MIFDPIRGLEHKQRALGRSTAMNKGKGPLVSSPRGLLEVSLNYFDCNGYQDYYGRGRNNTF
jgi:hypothetical protein